MGQKSASKLLKMIPREIGAIIMELPTLSSENEECYYDMLLFHAETYKPKGLDWFDVKEACVLSWEKQRMHRLTPSIFETSRAVADARQKEEMLIQQYKSLAAAHPGEVSKKDLRQAIRYAKVREPLVEVKAFVECIPTLEAVENLQLSKDVRLRRVREALAERATIDAVPIGANDNEQEATKVAAPSQDESDEDRGDVVDHDHDIDQEGSVDESESDDAIAVTGEAAADAAVDNAGEEDEESGDPTEEVA